jgi:hypothetical protein
MASESLKITPDAQVDFFMSIIEAYVDKLTQAFSQSHDKDYAKAEWVLILENGHIGKLLNHHILVDAWEQMEFFLRRDGKLYSFIEEKPSGLMEFEFKFWLFFSPDTATRFFKNQIDKPKGFSKSAITSLPFLKLLEPISTKLEKLLADKETKSLTQVQKIIEILELSKWYLDKQDFTILDVQIRKGVREIILAEAESLLQSIKNPRTSSLLLEKRLKNIFKLGWRYFRSKNELESKYYKKLLSENLEDREKGLKLTLKKVTDAGKRAQTPPIKPA